MVWNFGAWRVFAAASLVASCTALRENVFSTSLIDAHGRLFSFLVPLWDELNQNWSLLHHLPRASSRLTDYRERNAIIDEALAAIARRSAVPLTNNERAWWRNLLVTSILTNAINETWDVGTIELIEGEILSTMGRNCNMTTLKQNIIECLDWKSWSAETRNHKITLNIVN